MKIYNLAFLLLFQFPLACNESLEFQASPTITDSQQKLNRNQSGTANIVFKSTDGGQTWLDISKGLPENLHTDSIRGNSFFANYKGLFLRLGNVLYHNRPNATTPFWTKEIFTDEHNSITASKSGISDSNYWGVNLNKTNGTSVWSQ